jgi:SAM-dependent methyltransferase
MSHKDYFSGHAKVYAAFRPTYPEDLYRFIFNHLKNMNTAWDCATGNGQVATRLAKNFNRVYATDISEQQLQEAEKASNIFYSVSKAEDAVFPDDQFDLITVAQALHWIDTGKFYNEVNRTLKQDGLIAVWGYALLTVDPKIDKLFTEFYFDTVGPYWDEARKLVENQYRTVPFPFELIETPAFYITVDWSLDHFTGYLTSWSATQKYIRTHHVNPVDEFIPRVKEFWKAGEQKRVTFPVFMKLGKKKK